MITKELLEEDKKLEIEIDNLYERWIHMKFHTKEFLDKCDEIEHKYYIENKDIREYYKTI